MDIRFEYTVEAELERVKQTYAKKAFFEEYRYEVVFPEGVSFDNFSSFSEAELKALISQQMDKKRAAEIQKEISGGSLKNTNDLEKYFNELPGTRPSFYEVVFTQYGTGGSYNPPNKIILNISMKKANPFSIFVHEATHCQIEWPIVQEYKLSQPEKESIVNWLMLENPSIRKIFPNDKYQKFGAPSEELLKGVGLIDKGK